MQLDRTRIAIHPRGWLEILDLALMVLRSHALPLIVALALGALPMALFNAWLLRSLTTDFKLEESPQEYVLFLAAFTLVEAPLATAAVTLYLGKSLFVQKPRASVLFQEFLAALLQLILLQVILRGIMALFWITLLFPYMSWPYLNEIILLEQNRLRARPKSGSLSTWQRSSALHGSMGGELLMRALGSLAISVALITAIWVAGWVLMGMLFVRWQFDRPIYLIGLPLAMWTVAGFFAIVRFLSYLDLRIRREGWEVDLCLRAERARMERQIA